MIYLILSYRIYLSIYLSIYLCIYLSYLSILQVHQLNNFRPAWRNACAGGDVPPLETLMSRLQGVPQGKVFPFKKHTCKTKKQKSSAPLSGAGGTRGG
jgi:hypothetical protein